MRGRRYHLGTDNCQYFVDRVKEKYNNLGTYSLNPLAGKHCTSTVMESLYEAGVIGKGLESISYHLEIADPEEFYEHFLIDIKHQAGYLTSDEKIPVDLDAEPPINAIAAPNNKAHEIKVR